MFAIETVCTQAASQLLSAHNAQSLIPFSNISVVTVVTRVMPSHNRELTGLPLRLIDGKACYWRLLRGFSCVALCYEVASFPGLPRFFTALLSTETEEQKKRGRPGNEASYEVLNFSPFIRRPVSRGKILLDKYQVEGVS